jgi:hypothetical protein
MPEQERGPVQGPGGAARRPPRKTTGEQIPIRAGTPLIRLDGLPATLRWAVWLLLAEATGLLAVSGVLAFDAVATTSVSVTSAIATVVFTLLIAVLTGWLGRSLARLKRWARGPALVLQLLLLPIGYSITTNGVAILGIIVIVIGLGGVVTLLAPATRAALEDR